METTDFTKWKSRPLHLGKLFISDGIIDMVKWECAPTKVLLLLKEAYDGDPDAVEDWSLSDLIRDDWKGAKYKIWHTASQWIYGIHQLRNTQKVHSHDNIDLAMLDDALLSAAVVNIKKSGGTSHSNFENLQEYVDQDWDLLDAQISSISPDIVICGFTWELIKSKIPNAEKISDLVYKGMGTIFVDFWHPANQYPDKLNYYTLCTLISNAGIFNNS